MTRPITTAPADTARAMHAAEMRGQDMQDEDECTDCEGSGVTHQTERYCTCAAGRELARYADDAPLSPIAVDGSPAPDAGGKTKCCMGLSDADCATTPSRHCTGRIGGKEGV